MTSKFGALLMVLFSAFCAGASWYWPFGEDEEYGRKVRLSELLLPVSTNIDAAVELRRDEKFSEAIEKYRLALAELDRIEREDRDWEKTPAYSTIKNKRAYVNSAIDSLLLEQAKQNAKAVSVSDTTGLEKKLAEEKAKVAEAKARKETEEKSGKVAEAKARKETEEKSGKVADQKVKQKQKSASRKTKSSWRQRAADYIAAKDYAAADLLIREALDDRPNNISALNLQAAMYADKGMFREARESLIKAIKAKPRIVTSYYNMARLILQYMPEKKDMARRYYETGREYGGKRDRELEKLLK